MSRVLEKALTALFTDLETGELMVEVQALRLGIGLGLTVAAFFLLFGFALGVTP
ncbi:hypothetical protein HHL26_04725 [Sphingobium sp. TB-6]|uniref:hypothetical protein n=1 Tax=Sphingobium sp. TB-6 TaxID=2728850 RepID=UPI00146E2F34|nr:hypothetical protein [Sphingobium sp. TB-6]NML88369.1 hypothetical protein [Sphingobium sp. TB-6]